MNLQSIDINFIGSALLCGLFAWVFTKYVYNPTEKSKNNLKTQVTESIYVAGAWIHRLELQKKMNDLRNKGFNITSNWPGRENRINTPDDYRDCSEYDIREITKADTLLAFMTDDTYAYRGTFTELGFAIGSKRRIIVICNGTITHIDDDTHNCDFSHYCMRNVFFWDPRIEHVACYEDALKLISGEVVESPFAKFYVGYITKEIATNTELVVQNHNKDTFYGNNKKESKDNENRESKDNENIESKGNEDIKSNEDGESKGNEDRESNEDGESKGNEDRESNEDGESKGNEDRESNEDGESKGNEDIESNEDGESKGNEDRESNEDGESNENEKSKEIKSLHIPDIIETKRYRPKPKWLHCRRLWKLGKQVIRFANIYK